ncbi:unnamed protein product, partial [marine sediment metagenome]
MQGSGTLQKSSQGLRQGQGQQASADTPQTGGHHPLLADSLGKPGEEA